MQLHNISKIYHNRNNEVLAINTLDLTIENKDFILLLGPSGCGKTTLLNIIGGVDTDFTGSINKKKCVAYVEQEIRLFESMTVKENLYLANNDKKFVDIQLERFKLKEHGNKKVLELSNGQKKRVQIIQKLCLNPDILLCDEPTAALDKDNAEIVLEELKRLSKKMCVMIATHEENMTKSYADRIIRMQDGKLISDDHLHDTEKLDSTFKHQKRNIREYASYSLAYVVSRPWTLLLSLLFFILTTLTVYGSIYSIYTLKTNDESAITWYYGENQVRSYPNQVDYDEFGTATANQFDVYSIDAPNLIMDEVPEIIGFTAGWEGAFYNSIVTNSKGHNFLDYVEKGFFCVDRSKDQLIDINYLFPPMPQLFINPEQHRTTRATVYEMRSFSDLPLLLGSVPEKDHEILISRDYANLILENLGLSNIQELIGKQIDFYAYVSDQRYSNASDYHLKLTISGITSYTNQAEYQMFLCENVYDHWRVEKYKMNKDEMRYEYLNFILDPKTNFEKTIEKINQSYPQSFSHFEQGMFVPDMNADDTLYERPRNLLLISFLCFLCIFILECIIENMKYKQKYKENNILKCLDYKVMLCKILEEFYLLGMTLCILLCTMQPICVGLNTLSSHLGYGDMISFVPWLLCVVALFTTVMRFMVKLIIMKIKDKVK